IKSDRLLLSYTHISYLSSSILFSFTTPAPTQIFTLSLHDALPISCEQLLISCEENTPFHKNGVFSFIVYLKQIIENDSRLLLHRSEEHTSELQSRFDLVCRLLLEKKKKRKSRY